MKWSIIIAVLLATVLVCSSSSVSRRLTRLEHTVRDLVRDVKEIKKRPNSVHLAGATINALEMESRALSHFDSQMRTLQESLDQLVRRKDRQADLAVSLRQDLIVLK